MRVGLTPVIADLYRRPSKHLEPPNKAAITEVLPPSDLPAYHDEFHLLPCTLLTLGRV